MSEFTKGPWYAVKSGRNQHVYSIYRGEYQPSPSAQGLAVCIAETASWVEYSHGANSKESAANAHLLAAAPDMYEALKNARGQVKMFSGPDDPINNAILAQIDAAIAKAGGR